MPYKSDDSWVCRHLREAPFIHNTWSGSPASAIVEGEKAAIATEKLYNGQVCCHHGEPAVGRKLLETAKGRDVYIYPDNDEPGFALLASYQAFKS